jgi:cysteine desulfurase
MKIYLDNNATTEIDPRVASVFSEALINCWGNPSSIHELGQMAKAQLTKARRQIAQILGVKPLEVFFTASATESANQILKSAFLPDFRGHLITSDVEHPCVYSVAHWLVECGVNVTFLKAGEKGYISAEQVEEALQDDTRLVALMAVNNETGVKSDVSAIAHLLDQKGVPYFVDGVAWIGKEDVTLPKGVTACSFSGHKFHGPKGSAGLVLRSSFHLEPLIHGGPQEFNKRGGTENLPGAIALAAALSLCVKEKPWSEVAKMRDLMESLLAESVPPVHIFGQGNRICNTSCIAFPGVDGESLIMSLDLQGVFVSHGSACSSGSLEPSRVLMNMGADKALARSSIRISLGRFTTEEEVREAAKIIAKTVSSLRRFSQ